MELTLEREIVVNKTACRAIGVTAFVLLSALGAFVRIPLPFTPVPLTLQTFFVLLSAACLGGSLAIRSQLIYILLGVAGLPIFTGAASGAAVLVGPTGGYLVGFIAAVFFIGKTIGYAKGSFLLTFGLFCLADFILLACGALWLGVLFGLDFAKMFWLGFSPFVPGDLFKAFLAASIYFRFKTRLREIF